jgi:hypothetical protein
MQKEPKKSLPAGRQADRLMLPRSIPTHHPAKRSGWRALYDTLNSFASPHHPSYYWVIELSKEWSD